ncbi:uncharacterized protein LOC132049555 [Lycium ferocissimum]|uniref:uncharacterized protein LOC132049555 n=1 Tax=Lycium ferocissimum TaxID=112874 RepID=UPI0028168926|nr:uncharacterized protein LOC132049555 [Lycium ferocissimum]
MKKGKESSEEDEAELRSILEKLVISDCQVLSIANDSTSRILGFGFHNSSAVNFNTKGSLMITVWLRQTESRLGCMLRTVYSFTTEILRWTLTMASPLGKKLRQP